MWKGFPEGVITGLLFSVLLLGLARLMQGRTIGPWFWFGLLGWAGLVLLQHACWTRQPILKSLGVALTVVVAGFFVAAGFGWIGW